MKVYGYKLVSPVETQDLASLQLSCLVVPVRAWPLYETVGAGPSAFPFGGHPQRGAPTVDSLLFQPGYLCYIFLLLLLILSGTLLFNPLTVEAQSSSAHAQSDSLKDSSDSVHPSGQSNFLFKFYRDYISSADGDRCPMSPSCSGYGEQAIRKHGIFMGWIMTCDRLIRCGRDEVHLSETVESGAKQLTLDPVDANDFWWYPSASSKRYPHGSSN